MALSIYNISHTVYDQDGSPVENALVKVRLAQSETVVDGHTIPTEQLFYTDENGEVTMPLVTNQTGGYYLVSEYEADGSVRFRQFKIQVGFADANAVDITVETNPAGQLDLTLNGLADCSTLDSQLGSYIRQIAGGGFAASGNNDFRNDRNALSGGIIAGCVLNRGTPAGTFSISAGSYRIVNNHTDPENPTVTEVEFDGVTDESIPHIATDIFSFVWLKADGTVELQRLFAGEAFEVRRRKAVWVGVLWHFGDTNIDHVWRSPQMGFNDAHAVYDVLFHLGNTCDGGALGWAGDTVNVRQSAGTITGHSIGYTGDEAGRLNPNTYEFDGDDPCNLSYWWTDNSTLMDQTAPHKTLLGNGSTVIPTDEYVIDSVFVSVDTDGTVRNWVSRTTTSYQTMAEAESHLLDTDPTGSVGAVIGAFVGWMIVRQGWTDLSDTTQWKFIEADRFGNSIGNDRAEAVDSYCVVDAAADEDFTINASDLCKHMEITDSGGVLTGTYKWLTIVPDSDKRIPYFTLINNCGKTVRVRVADGYVKRPAPSAYISHAPAAADVLHYYDDGTNLIASLPTTIPGAALP